MKLSMTFVMKFARLVSISVLMAAACDRDPVAHLPPLHPVSVEPQSAYAGGRITIKSARFRDLDSVHVFVDTFQLATHARGDDSVVVVLPRSARGSYTLRLGRNGLPLGEIEIAGYVGFKPITRFIGNYLDVWPEGGRASVIAGNYRDNVVADVLQVMPATGLISTLVSGFPIGWDVPRTPGRTHNDGVVLLQPRAGNAQAWRLLPGAQVVDTLPFENLRHAAVFNDSTYFRAFHHRVETRRFDGRYLYMGTYEETHEVILSPTRDRATLRVNGSQTGPPVFNMATGDTAYHVRQLFRSYGAAFSEHGDTLWMLGVTPNDLRSSLVMLNARTGVLLKQIFFDDDVSAEAMRRDAGGGRIFILDWKFPESPVNLLVLDEQTLDVIGQVDGPVCADDFTCRWFVVAVGIDGVFVVHPRGIYAFDYIF